MEIFSICSINALENARILRTRMVLNLLSQIIWRTWNAHRVHVPYLYSKFFIKIATAELEISSFNQIFCLNGYQFLSIDFVLSNDIQIFHRKKEISSAFFDIQWLNHLFVCCVFFSRQHSFIRNKIVFTNNAQIWIIVKHFGLWKRV